MKKKKIGIVGLGAIGNYLIERIMESDKFELMVVDDIEQDRYVEIATRYKPFILYLPIAEFPNEIDIIIECASVEAVEGVVRKGLRRAKTVVIASIGGLLDKPELWDYINKAKGNLVLPSCAIGGLDIINAIPKEDIEELSICTRKNPKSLTEEYANIESEVEIFSSSALDAVKKFPRNMNVAALLAIAGIGADRTKVRIIADPKVERNIHEVSIISKSGKYTIKCENFPFESNPKSSKLAAQSIWALIDSMDSRISYGS